jgi:hypothetical protein
VWQRSGSTVASPGDEAVSQSVGHWRTGTTTRRVRSETSRGGVSSTTRIPSPKTVELEDEYYHVRFRDPDEFSEIRTPEWATEAAAEIANGSKVRTGHRKGSDDRVVQSVLIPRAAGKSKARSQAQRVVEKLEG